ncbi:MAG: hypothetical protein WDZ75_01795 [Candidatus Paceibacterota bacterium]
MFFNRIYREDGAPTEKLFLSKEVYRNALRSFVKYCHDIILVGEDGYWYLPSRRDDNTFPGPWFIGGAVTPFISFKESLSQLIRRELQLDIDPERLVHLGNFRCFFRGDAQKNAHDAVSELFVLKLSMQEIDAITLDKSEYIENSLKKYTREDISVIPEKLNRKILLEAWDDYSKMI